jgi:folate-binding protein YgfZ
LNIRAGLAEVVAQTQEEFIPQMLNLQHTGAVNFRKGCYTGQEIVARMQYLGKLKRRMYRLQVESNQLLAPGTAINSGDKSAIGTVVMAQMSGQNQQEILAVLVHEAADAHQLRFGETELAVTNLPLPYDDQFVVATR